MVDVPAVFEVLRTIDDPEMPISIVDLGLVVDVRVTGAQPRSTVEVDLTPTFLGCPALDLIAGQIKQKVGAAGPCEVRVNWLRTPAWSVDRISDAGRERLRRFGVSTPVRGSAASGSASGAPAAFTMLTISGKIAAAPSCPYCGEGNAQLESPFGPTRCRMIYYCPDCRNSFEHLKAI